MSKKLRLLVLTPVGYNHSPLYWISMLKLSDYLQDKNITLEYSYNRISNIYYARETLAAKARDEHDWVLWIDSDCVFEPEQVMRLIEHDKEFVAGIAKFQDKKLDVTKWNFGKYIPEAMDKLGIWLANHPVTEPLEDKLLSVDYVGMHFTLMKTSALKKLNDNERFEPLPLSLIHKDLPGYMSEDGAFCWKLKKVGVDILVDPGCVTGHHKDIVLK